MVFDGEALNTGWSKLRHLPNLEQGLLYILVVSFVSFAGLAPDCLSAPTTCKRFKHLIGSLKGALGKLSL